MNAVIKALSFITLTVLSVILTGFTISTLWGWFVVPLGVKTIGVAQAFGLSTIIMFFKLRNRKKFVNDVLVKKTKVQEWTEHFCLPIAALVIGYITTLFM